MSYGFNEFLSDLVENKANPTDEIYNYLSPVDTKRLNLLLKRLERIRGIDSSSISEFRKSFAVSHKSISDSRKNSGWKTSKKSIDGSKSNLTGRVFEQIIRLLFKDCVCIQNLTVNVRSTTAEIDVLLEISPLAKVVPFLKDVANHLIGEAKCYATGVKAEWINELCGIMDTHATKHGLLFVASEPKKMNRIHITAIHMHSVAGKHIVPFGLTQLFRVANGDNVLKVLSEQYSLVLTRQDALFI